jgi:flagellar hook-basal body complex protein FliE
MAISPLPPIGSLTGGTAARGVTRPAEAGFGEALQKGLQGVSDLERSADTVAQSLASGGPAQIHDLMIATTKSQVSLDALVAVRNRAVEAYQEVMRLQV